MLFNRAHHLAGKPRHGAALVCRYYPAGKPRLLFIPDYRTLTLPAVMPFPLLIVQLLLPVALDFEQIVAAEYPHEYVRATVPAGQFVHYRAERFQIADNLIAVIVGTVTHCH